MVVKSGISNGHAARRSQIFVRICAWDVKASGAGSSESNVPRWRSYDRNAKVVVYTGPQSAAD